MELSHSDVTIETDQVGMTDINIDTDQDENDELMDEQTSTIDQTGDVELVTIIPESTSNDINIVTKDKNESSSRTCDYYVDMKSSAILLHSTQKSDISGEITDIDDPTQPKEIFKERKPISRCCSSFNLCSLLSFKSYNCANS